MKKKIFLLLCSLFCFGSMRAEMKMCLQVVASDGVTNIPLASILHIVYPDENSVQIALNTLNELTFEINQVTKMIFAEADVTTTGIENFVLSPDSLAGAKVYDLAGRCIGDILLIDGRIDVSCLPQGVSIIKAGNKTIKVMR